MTRHILCAVDLQHAEADAKVLKRAAELAKCFGASLSVVTVIPDYGMSIVGSYFHEGTMKKAVRAANDQLHAFVADTLPDFGKVQHIVEVGNIYEMVLDAVKRSRADLVVMGAHKPDIIDRFQGPNSARVARYAKISVLIVRE
ncbi:nucleotide-binding universal stress UspA family protein [Rhodovulum bhavnagarense]|uniref:Universal stress protein n=1 Tax=Rhodovulum bhavnagarense TaxID=992286 RepID=A0A4R2RDK0_9RHOB|nr:universal stress protein [Rhodovulum bhavnagarense]TCP60269.1 nucleotide-binding universal stress UspA family protein [Rhodovulum bhavnagarense]